MAGVQFSRFTLILKLTDLLACDIVYQKSILILPWHNSVVNSENKNIVYCKGGNFVDFPKLTFPMTVDFCSAGYWINDQGPFKYGAATTALFIGEEIGSAANDGIPLLRELEQQLQTFGSHLKPYVW